MVDVGNIQIIRAQYLGPENCEIRYLMGGKERVLNGETAVSTLWQPADGYVRTEGGSFTDAVVIMIQSLGFPGEIVG